MIQMQQVTSKLLLTTEIKFLKSINKSILGNGKVT